MMLAILILYYVPSSISKHPLSHIMPYDAPLPLIIPPSRPCLTWNVPMLLGPSNVIHLILLTPTGIPIPHDVLSYIDVGIGCVTFYTIS